jgi:hypothetical protein
MANIVTIGIDIGQKHDPTAIAVIETEERQDGNHSIVRHLERLLLGTPYPEVARRLAMVVARATEHQEAPRAGAVWPIDTVPPTVWLDATGVGQPVVDLLKAAGVTVTPVYFTHGDRLVENKETGSVSLGKALLVSQLQVLLQSRRLHLPRTAEAQALAKELLDYEIKVDENANDKYGAFKIGSHDDQVSALGLAVLAVERGGRVGVWFA